MNAALSSVSLLARGLPDWKAAAPQRCQVPQRYKVGLSTRQKIKGCCRGVHVGSVHSGTEVRRHLKYLKMDFFLLLRENSWLQFLFKLTAFRGRLVGFVCSELNNFNFLQRFSWTTSADLQERVSLFLKWGGGGCLWCVKGIVWSFLRSCLLVIDTLSAVMSVKELRVWRSRIPLGSPKG